MKGNILGFLEFDVIMFDYRKEEEDKEKGIDKPYTSYIEYTKLRFKLEDVSSFHSTNDDHIMVGFYHGPEYKIKVKYHYFCLLMDEYYKLLYATEVN